MSTCCVKNKWKYEETLCLISLIEENPCLWNVELVDHRDRRKRERAISNIASILRTTAEEVKKKIHGLRTQFTNERSKMTKWKSGDGTSARYKTKWEFYDSLQFMFQNSSKSETVDSMGRTTVSIDNGGHDANNDRNDGNEIAEGVVHTGDDDSQAPFSVASTSRCQPPSSLKRKKAKTNAQSDVDLQELVAINRCMAVLNAPKKRKDEYTLFGENVANELRQLTDVEDVQFKLKSDILKSILEANTAAHAERKRKKISCAPSTLSSPGLSDPFSSSNE